MPRRAVTFRRLLRHPLASAAAIVAPSAAILYAATLAFPPPQALTPDALCGPDALATHDHAPALGPLSFFTGDGAYRARTHCMVNEAGAPDWPWIILLIGLIVAVCAFYLRIFVFWRTCHLREDPRDRNEQLMQLAYIFLFCAICGYGFSILSFAWPAYRLLAVFLIVLNVWCLRFTLSLDRFGLSFQSLRLQRELRESLESRNAELERLVSERTSALESARAEADAANRAKSDFLANMSHEIRTPLTAILGFTELLEERAEPDEQRERIAILRRNGVHLLDLINDVLDLSKIEAGELRCEEIPTSPAEIINDAVSLLRHRAEEKGLVLTTSLDTPIPASITSDPTRIRQILTNLLGNAVKFTDRGGITLAASLDDSGAAHTLRITVADTGPGLTHEKAERVFEAFSQADRSTARKHGGTGLGLTISRSLARALGGDLTLESTPGAGAAFTLSLPVAPAQLARRTDSLDAPHPAGAPSNNPTPTTISARVLIADDSHDNLRLIAHHLRRAGAEVHLVTDGRRALDAVDAAQREGAPFDCILMDLQMPGMGGREAARTLRERGCDTPIIALTAHALSTERAACLDAGFNDYATKPIGRDALLRVCARWSGRRAA